MALSRRFWAVLIATTLAACGASKPPAPPPPLVLVAVPLQRQVEDWDDFVGQFESPASVDVRPRVTGYVTAVGFRDGQEVRKGQLLFQIDPRPYAAAFDQAKAQEAHAASVLADAKVELNRSQQLLTAHATSQQDVDTRLASERTAEADVAAARAAEQTAALNLGFTHVISPISGRASDAKILPGNLVTQDVTVLTSVVATDPIRFRFTGPEAQFLKYKRQALIGDGREPPVQIRLQDEADYRWSRQSAGLRRQRLRRLLWRDLRLRDGRQPRRVPHARHVRPHAAAGLACLYGSAGARPGNRLRPIAPGGAMQCWGRRTWVHCSAASTSGRSSMASG